MITPLQHLVRRIQYNFQSLLFNDQPYFQIVYEDKTVLRNQSDENHCKFGPAVKYNPPYSVYVVEEWFLNNKRHNIFGPAIIRKNPDPFTSDKIPYLKEYWIDGIQYSEEDFYQHTKLLSWIPFISKLLS